MFVDLKTVVNLCGVFLNHVKEDRIQVTTWVNLENLMLSKIRQVPRSYIAQFHLCEIPRISKSIKAESGLIDGYQGHGWQKAERRVFVTECE
jgi:hypothetical protein